MLNGRGRRGPANVLKDAHGFHVPLKRLAIDVFGKGIRGVQAAATFVSVTSLVRSFS